MNSWRKFLKNLALDDSRRFSLLVEPNLLLYWSCLCVNGEILISLSAILPSIHAHALFSMVGSVLAVVDFEEGSYAH